MRVAISGAHCTGKTTLVREVIERMPDVIAQGNIMRSMIQLGHGVGPNTTPETLATYLLRQTELEGKASPSANAICDRVFADGVAYVLAAVDLGIAAYTWTPEVLELLKSVAVLHAARYDRHVLVRTLLPLPECHPMHVYGSSYQQLVDSHLHELLQHQWSVEVVELFGTLDDNVRTVTELLQRS